MKSYSISALCTLLFLFAFAYVGGINISGTINDESGNPMPGVSIYVKGTRTGTVSDGNGKFSIVVPNNKAVLIISSVGMETQQVKVQNQTSLNIVLKAASQSLEEVVVTGLNVPIEDVVDHSRLYGSRAAGVSVIIRGAASISASNKTDYYDNYQEQKVMDNGLDREGYDHITENRFLRSGDNPLSTFSIDVDAASYSNVRRMLNNNQLPPAGAVRIEELINYFTYKYPQPKGEDPFSINTEIAKCPWNEEHRIVSIGLQGKKIPVENLPASNLTFLIDVSGSMGEMNKLPLVKSSLKLLADQLREQDKVSIVVYAGNAGLVLPPTSGSNKEAIKEALNKLESGGSTAGGQGIALAYKTARENFVTKGNNRVILCTDGDFNVGISSDDELESLIEKERKSGVFLTVLGYGMGNYQDAKMQKLADKGNGNHAYIDDISEAKKVLVNEFGGTLFTIAKDVKLQIEFNPAKVQGYRLIGYENRMLAKEDFNNDKKDAGELGSGHTVTALYEIVPVGIKTDVFDKVDALKYQKVEKKQVAVADFNRELLNIKLRYKQPDGDISKLLQHPVMDQKIGIESTSDNLRFATAVAGFGMLLRQSEYKGNASYKSILQLATGAIENDLLGYRKEFINLLKAAQRLSKDVAVEPVLNNQED